MYEVKKSSVLLERIENASIQRSEWHSRQAFSKPTDCVIDDIRQIDTKNVYRKPTC